MMNGRDSVDEREDKSDGDQTIDRFVNGIIVPMDGDLSARSGVEN